MEGANDSGVPARYPVLRTIVRFIGWAFLALIVLIAVIGAVAGVQQLAHDRARSRVTAFLQHKGEGCAKDYPLAVWVRNGSEKQVDLTYMQISGRQQGYS